MGISENQIILIVVLTAIIIPIAWYLKRKFLNR
jgi:hypothetical protein